MNSLVVLLFAILCCALVMASQHYSADYEDIPHRRPVHVDVGENYHERTPGYYPSYHNIGNTKGIKCGPLPDIKNGKVEIVPDTKKASIAMYICDEGFVLYGKGQRVCSYGGKWSGRPAKCVPVRCGRLPNIRNGRLILSGIGFRDTATYLCKEGFDLIGDRQRKCQENEEWSGSEPECSKISCPKLSPPSNGKLFLSGRYPSDIAIYSCAYGYYLDGQKRRECLRTGEWSGSDPACKEIEPIKYSKKAPKKDYYSDDDYDD